MNGFFTNLVDRHLGTCDTIQPRSLGRFETDQNNMLVADGIVANVTERGQTLQTSDELSIADSPTVTDRKQDSIKRKNDFSSLSDPGQNQANTTTQSNFTEQNIDNFDSQVLPVRSQMTHSLDGDTPPNRATVKQNQKEQSTLVDDNGITNGRTKNNSDTLDKVMRENNPLPRASTSEHILESELNHRIQAMLKHLTKDRSSPGTSDKQNDRSQQNTNKTLKSVLPHTDVPLLDTASPELSSVSKSKVIQEENNFSENKKITLNHSQLEASSRLSDTISQLKQRLQEKEVKAEPVVNVTIGRVEVRAVQKEPSKNTRHTKKPTGVMTLDDYLKRREGRGSK